MIDIRAMIEMLRYQYPQDLAQLASPCPCCGDKSRGGFRCAKCMSQDMIAAGAKPEHIQLLRDAFQHQREAAYQVQDVIETIMEIER